MMTTYGVNTLISDSGVIKYRIVTEQWDVNTVRQPSRWEFMKGIFFEQFDEKFRVQGYIQADTAWYFDQQRLWKLRGRVNVRNTNGLIYTSEELYWDGLKHEFYSYVYSRLVTPERTIEGTYFRSDEQMTHYMVTNSKGSFLPNDLEEEKADPQKTRRNDTADYRTTNCNDFLRLLLRDGDSVCVEQQNAGGDGTREKRVDTKGHRVIL